MVKFRIGHGYDVHRLVPDRRLILGGVDIPYALGLDGHSDADVLVHAIMDALIGALGLGDIGRYFPDTSDDFKDISSMILLDNVRKLLAENKASIVNIDATVILQKPKVASYIDAMRKNVACTLGIDAEVVNIKATTEENMGFTGRCEGVAAHAVALILF